jgi:Histidine kinase
MKQGKLYTVLLHVIGWVVFLILPTIMLPPDRLTIGFDINALLLYVRISTLPLIGFFYLHLLVLLPKLYLRRRYFVYGLWLVTGLGATILINRWLFVLMFSPEALLDNRVEILLPAAAVRTGVVLVVSFVLFIYQRWRLSEFAKAQAELSYLKAQINPHFLFNTLNSIYYLTLQQSEQAPVAVEKLSAIMRYVIDEGNHDRVPLEREVSYLNDYIALQKLRFTDNVRIDLEVQGDMVGKEIAPLIMVSFVENAFKHGISMEVESPIRITLAVSSDHIRFTVRNRKFGSFADAPPESGIGLENTKRRLEIAYPGRHALEILEDEEAYEVTLKLSLQ